MTLRLPSLNAVLAVDAAGCAGLAALCLAAPGPLARLLGLPPGLSLAAGLTLASAALVIAHAARLRPVPPLLARLIVAGNAGWIAASIGVLAVVPLTGLGVAVVAAQALVVMALTLVEARLLGAAVEGAA
jgi:hypothetical protein